MTAVDRDAQRLSQVADNLQRLRRAARLVAADLSVPQTGWAGKPFDRILLDAPCSATGVIRRHPDIKLLRRADDIAALAAQQAAILRSCWRMLRPGGTLLYATCSLLPAENAAIVAAFLADEPSASETTPAMLAQLPFLRRCAVGWQMLPGGEAGGDGFYYACLARTQAPASQNTA
jgi:16S rRNA (cytosine967-C5)-methyltransferase